MNNKKQYFLIGGIVLIVIGCLGTFAKEPGIYSAVFMLGIASLIVSYSVKK